MNLYLFLFFFTGGGKSHVCSKCGWNYPNPHPSAKNRRAHKKICGTIKGFEILGSDQNLDLHKEDCLDDEQKTPSKNILWNCGGKNVKEHCFNLCMLFVCLL